MDIYKEATYLGRTRIHFKAEGASVSETIYPAGLASNWHYHQNPYFTLILHGGSLEQRKKQSHECLPGQLLFYDFDEQHRNVNYQPDSRNLNVEFDRLWLENQGIKLCDADQEGEFIKIALLRMLSESRANDSLSELSIQSLLLECHSGIERQQSKINPVWVKKIREILWDKWNEVPTLRTLSTELDLHPVTISRYFSRYFGCTLGDYMRRIKTDKALEQLKRTNLNLVEISIRCGFSDLSHFNRVFKRYTGFLPRQFRNL